MSEVVEETNVEETNVVEEKAKKPDRVVVMEDGTAVNFGVRANVITEYDFSGAVVTFKLITGKIISWTHERLKEFSEFDRKVMLYGMAQRIKTSLTSVKLDDLQKVIEENVRKMDSGIFSIRSSDSDEPSLSTLQKAFAIVVSRKKPEFAHWVNFDDSSVVAEILNKWEEMGKSERNKVRKNAYVKLEMELLKIADGEEEELF